MDMMTVKLVIPNRKAQEPSQVSGDKGGFEVSSLIDHSHRAQDIGIEGRGDPTGHQFILYRKPEAKEDREGRGLETSPTKSPRRENVGGPRPTARSMAFPIATKK